MSLKVHVHTRRCYRLFIRRKLRWDDRVWNALIRASAYIPPSVRVEALMSIIEESERIATSRGSDVVEEYDLVLAAYRRVPLAYRRVSFQILKEQGIDVDKWVKKLNLKL